MKHVEFVIISAAYSTYNWILRDYLFDVAAKDARRRARGEGGETSIARYPLQAN